MQIYQDIIKQLLSEMGAADLTAHFWTNKSYPKIAINKDWNINNALRIKAIFIYETIVSPYVQNQSNDLYSRIMTICNRLDAAEMRYPYPRYLSRETRRLIRDLKKDQKELALISTQLLFVRKASEIVLKVQRFALDESKLFAKERVEIFSTLVSILLPDLPEGSQFSSDLRKKLVWLLHSYLHFELAIR